MKMNRPFNTLNLKEYIDYIENHKKYSDFNTLGLYRSLNENKQLSLDEKIHIRDHANHVFQKTFDFLQLKDPQTYFKVSTLGQELTKADEQQIWDNIKRYQQQILSDKKIKHRNFGTYSLHDCGHESCPLKGLMIKQGSSIAYGEMHFKSDKSSSSGKEKSFQQKVARKQMKQIIRKELEED